MKRLHPIALAAIPCAGVAAGVALVSTSRLLVDENPHARQVRVFMEGRFELDPLIATLPGYHAALALAMLPFGSYGDLLARITSLAGALLLLPLAWAIVRRHAPADAPLRTAQVLYQPSLYPFLFLVYTDAWSLVAIAAMVLAVLRQRYVLAGIAAAVAIAIRQDAVVWVAFAWTLAALKDVEPRGWREGARLFVRNGLLAGWPLLAVVVVTLAVAGWTASIAFGGKAYHPFTVNLTNLYFFLLCAWLAFLPDCIAAWPRLRIALRNPWILAALAAGFALYFLTWGIEHDFNRSRFFLRNEALYWITREPALRAALYMPVAWAALTLATMPLPEWRLRTLPLFVAAAAALHPVIDPRYYLPAILMYQLWRPSLPGPWEAAILIVYAIAAVLLLWGSTRGLFFI